MNHHGGGRGTSPVNQVVTQLVDMDVYPLSYVKDPGAKHF
jgi:hypothetical protein